MSDPTAEVMRDYLREEFPGECEPDTEDMTLCFAVECAIYWFASHYHGGQTTNLYSALSTSEYHPGACESGPEAGSLDDMMYEALEHRYGS